MKKIKIELLNARFADKMLYFADKKVIGADKRAVAADRMLETADKQLNYPQNVHLPSLSLIEKSLPLIKARWSPIECWNPLINSSITRKISTRPQLYY